MKKSLKSAIHSFFSKKSSFWDKLVLFLIFSFISVLYLRLGRDYLFNWDEGIYAQLGVEALKFHHWLTPTWNGQIWLEKPPGIAWLTALGMKLWGIGEFGARFFMPLVAGITLYLTYLIGKKLKDRYLGILASLLLANMNLFLSRARAVNTDGILLAGITATVYLTMIGAAPWLVAFAVALSVFFKGLAGFLSLIIVFPLLINKPKKYLLLVTGYWLLFILPWHLYQLIIHKSAFITPYFKEQVLRRATVPIEFHLESKWYYFRYLYHNLGIGWLFLLITGVILITFRIISLRQKPTSSLITETRSLITIIWWFLFPLTLFTLAKTRLFWYILPVYPAIALIVAYFLRFLANGNKWSLIILNLFSAFYILHTYQHLFNHIEFQRLKSKQPPSLALVSQVKTPRLLVLATETERIAKAILPKRQRISSSFRYGGAPNLVFYSRKPVAYFYNINLFKQALLSGNQALVQRGDYSRLNLPSLKIINKKGDYLLVQLK